jgi:hypothetical protein
MNGYHARNLYQLNALNANRLIGIRIECKMITLLLNPPIGTIAKYKYSFRIFVECPECHITRWIFLTNQCENTQPDKRLCPTCAQLKSHVIPIQKRFWSKVIKTESCWLWKGNTNIWGYGQTFFNGKAIASHRMSWILVYGEIPEGLCVLHKCDNPPCCNPTHLFLGTICDNNRDRACKGRNNISYGELHHNAKLSNNDVILIDKYLNENKTPIEIAKLFGVSYGTIYDIKKGLTWGHLTKRPLAVEKLIDSLRNENDEKR